MSESKTLQPPAGYPEGYPPPGYPMQAPQPQYVKVPAVTREKGGSKGCMRGFIKGFKEAICCLFQLHSLGLGQDPSQLCCPCGNCCTPPCCCPSGNCCTSPCCCPSGNCCTLPCCCPCGKKLPEWCPCDACWAPCCCCCWK